MQASMISGKQMPMGPNSMSDADRQTLVNYCNGN